MLNNWDKFMVDQYKKVRSRCRKGIPPSTRPEAWYYLCGAKYLMENPNDENRYQTNTKFEALCVSSICLIQGYIFLALKKFTHNISPIFNTIHIHFQQHTGENKWTDDIEKDLHRNFPNHELFGGAYKTIGQKELFLVLKAYSVYNPSVGYCQAQAPVAALLLMNLPTEKAFWCFVSICDKYLTGYYSSGMQAIQLDGDILFGLLKRVSYNAYRHLKKQGIEPILYMTEWFLCAFTRTLPWPTVLRIWDMFVCEGVKVLFKVGLVLLKNILTEAARKKCPTMYETLTLLKELPSDITSEAFLIPQVLQIDISEEVMAKEHRKQLDKRNKNNK